MTEKTRAGEITPALEIELEKELEEAMKNLEQGKTVSQSGKKLSKEAIEALSKGGVKEEEKKAEEKKEAKTESKPEVKTSEKKSREESKDVVVVEEEGGEESTPEAKPVTKVGTVRRKGRESEEKKEEVEYLITDPKKRLFFEILVKHYGYDKDTAYRLVEDLSKTPEGEEFLESFIQKFTRFVDQVYTFRKKYPEAWPIIEPFVREKIEEFATEHATRGESKLVSKVNKYLRSLVEEIEELQARILAFDIIRRMYGLFDGSSKIEQELSNLRNELEKLRADVESLRSYVSTLSFRLTPQPSVESGKIEDVIEEISEEDNKEGAQGQGQGGVFTQAVKNIEEGVKVVEEFFNAASKAVNKLVEIRSSIDELIRKLGGPTSNVPINLNISGLKVEKPEDLEKIIQKAIEIGKKMSSPDVIMAQAFADTIRTGCTLLINYLLGLIDKYLSPHLNRLMSQFLGGVGRLGGLGGTSMSGSSTHGGQVKK